ncbi:hypothetical protein SVIOM342S_04998 [Streptomyces violaceorubidus]
MARVVGARPGVRRVALVRAVVVLPGNQVRQVLRVRDQFRQHLERPEPPGGGVVTTDPCSHRAKPLESAVGAPYEKIQPCVAESGDRQQRAQVEGAVRVVRDLDPGVSGYHSSCSSSGPPNPNRSVSSLWVVVPVLTRTTDVDGFPE